MAFNIIGQGLAPHITGVEKPVRDSEGVPQELLEAKSFCTKDRFLAPSASVVSGATILGLVSKLDGGVECPEVPEEPELP